MFEYRRDRYGKQALDGYTTVDSFAEKSANISFFSFILDKHQMVGLVAYKTNWKESTDMYYAIISHRCTLVESLPWEGASSKHCAIARLGGKNFLTRCQIDSPWEGTRLAKRVFLPLSPWSLLSYPGLGRVISPPGPSDRAGLCRSKYKKKGQSLESFKRELT